MNIDLNELPLGGAIGIDPGSTSGCVAYVTANSAVACPIGKMTDQELWTCVAGFARLAQVAVVERVSSMPKQGVASSFKFGASYGALRMAIVAAGVPWRLVGPVEWQTAMRCRSGGDKRITRAVAQRLWPRLHVTHAMADALLLAEFARRGLPMSESEYALREFLG